MVGQECFADALLEGSQEVFETMMFMTVEKCSENEVIGDPAVLGSITFQGNIEGCLTVCCSEDCARVIASNMLALELDGDIDDDGMMDAMGEVANMVMGSVKMRIMGEVGDLQVSIPSVVRGSELTNSMGDDAEEITMTTFVDEEVARFSLMYRETSEEA